MPLSTDRINELTEEIIEVFLEHGDCEHDVSHPTSDTPGEHFISYNIDSKGAEKIKKILEAL